MHPGEENVEDNLVDDSIVENGGGDWGERLRNSVGTIFGWVFRGLERIFIDFQR